MSPGAAGAGLQRPGIRSPQQAGQAPQPGRPRGGDAVSNQTKSNDNFHDKGERLWISTLARKSFSATRFMLATTSFPTTCKRKSTP